MFISQLKVFCSAIFLLLCTHVMSSPTLKLIPNNNEVIENKNFVINVVAEDLQDLYAWQFDLKFNPLILKANKIEEGSFLSNQGHTFFLSGDIDNNNGRVTGTIASLLGNQAGVTGIGVLAQLSFTSLSLGMSNLELENYLLVNSNISEINVNSINSSVSVVPVPEPEIYGMLIAGIGLINIVKKRKKILIS